MPFMYTISTQSFSNPNPSYVIISVVSIINIVIISITVRHSLMLHWFADLMNVTEEVTIHRPNVSTLLSSAFIRGDLNAATRSPFYMITN